jgi:aspartyl protease family protein
VTEPNNAPPPPRSGGPRLLIGIALVVLIVLAVLYLARHGFVVDEADLPRLAGLVAILIFLGVGLIGRQIGAWQVIRSMVGWAAIILVIAGLYASRDELAGFAGRLLGALAPGVPVSGRLAGEANPDSVVITRAGDGHFAIRTTVDGVSVPMLVDTGASFVTLSYQDARRVGIDPDGLDYVVPIRTASGTMTAAGIVLDSLAVGPIAQQNVKALVAPRGTLDQSLLGMTFLDSLKGYAISGDRLILTP